MRRVLPAAAIAIATAIAWTIGCGAGPEATETNKQELPRGVRVPKNWPLVWSIASQCGTTPGWNSARLDVVTNRLYSDHDSSTEAIGFEFSGPMYDYGPGEVYLTVYRHGRAVAWGSTTQNSWAILDVTDTIVVMDRLFADETLLSHLGGLWTTCMMWSSPSSVVLPIKLSTHCKVLRGLATAGGAMAGNMIGSLRPGMSGVGAGIGAGLGYIIGTELLGKTCDKLEKLEMCNDKYRQCDAEVRADREKGKIDEMQAEQAFNRCWDTYVTCRLGAGDEWPGVWKDPNPPRPPGMEQMPNCAPKCDYGPPPAPGAGGQPPPPPPPPQKGGATP